MDIRYELAEKRAAAGTVTLTDDEEHAYLTARNTAERKAAVEAACVRHAEHEQTWSDDWTIGFDIVSAAARDETADR